MIHKLCGAIFSEPKDSKSKAFAQSVKASTDTDVKFSEGWVVLFPVNAMLSKMKLLHL